jgi:hypothetical protein
LNFKFQFEFSQKFFLRRRLHPLQESLGQLELGSDSFPDGRHRLAGLERYFRRKLSGQFT